MWDWTLLQELSKMSSPKLSKSKHKAKHGMYLMETHSDTESDERVFGISFQTHNQQNWIVDSRVWSHMTQTKELLVNYYEFDKSQKVGMEDGPTVRAAPIMLLILPIILFRISFKIHLLFQNYSQLLPIIPKLST